MLKKKKIERYKETSGLQMKWTGSRAREENSRAHALIMLYLRWYPLVSHFNNPPQLDVLVPSARKRLVTGPGQEPGLGPHHPLFDGEHNERYVPLFLLLTIPPRRSPPLRTRWRPLGVGVTTGRGQDRTRQAGSDSQPCKDGLILNREALPAPDL